MRGGDERRDGLFSYIRPENRIPKAHPLRLIRQHADEALTSLNEQFAMLYSDNGRPSIPPEQLLRALPGWMFQFKAAAYNLIRLQRLLATG